MGELIYVSNGRSLDKFADNPLEGMSLMERAEVILGSRLTSDSVSYLLDGKRVSAFHVINAAGLSLGRV